jgi:Na+-translocating ferredoxin:NAD+ oxidoreductase RnfC subunit
MKKSYTEAIESTQYYIGEYKNLRLLKLENSYPMGDEVVLVYEATGKVVPQGKVPITVGCVVMNVETVLNVYHALHDKEAVIYKYITLAGEVNRPLTVKVPLGITVQELLAMAGGIKRQDTALIMGGPMMGRFCNERDVVTKTTKSILVLPESCPPVAKRRRNTKTNLRNAMSVCSQCEMCTSLCPRAMLGHSIKPHEFMRALANGLTNTTEPYLNTFFCSGCGLCEMFSCHQDLTPRTLIAEYKGSLRAAGVKAPDKPIAQVNSFRNERRTPVSRLYNHLGLSEYQVPAPLTEEFLHQAKRVTLLLSQSIGAPCIPVVSPGDSVQAGQVVGQPPKEALGVDLHASISGTVKEVTDKAIVIEA